MGRNEDALTWLQRSITITPASGRPYLLLAVAYQRLGRLNEAKEAIAKAMALRPGSTAANTQLPTLNASQAFFGRGPENHAGHDTSRTAGRLSFAPAWLVAAKPRQPALLRQSADDITAGKPRSAKTVTSRSEPLFASFVAAFAPTPLGDWQYPTPQHNIRLAHSSEAFSLVRPGEPGYLQTRLRDASRGGLGLSNSADHSFLRSPAECNGYESLS